MRNNTVQIGVVAFQNSPIPPAPECGRAGRTAEIGAGFEEQEWPGVAGALEAPRLLRCGAPPWIRNRLCPPKELQRFAELEHTWRNDRRAALAEGPFRSERFAGRGTVLAVRTDEPDRVTWRARICCRGEPDDDGGRSPQTEHLVQARKPQAMYRHFPARQLNRRAPRQARDSCTRRPSASRPGCQVRRPTRDRAERCRKSADHRVVVGEQ